MDIQIASQCNLGSVTALLCEAHLPSSDIEPHLGNFHIALADGAIVGVVGIEAYGRVGLLRSLAVATPYQKRGIGKQLCQSMLAWAGQLGVRDIYLLTIDATAFFERFGFRPVDRSVVPVEIQKTEEFSQICPVSAVVMHRVIGAFPAFRTQNPAPPVRNERGNISRPLLTWGGPDDGLRSDPAAAPVLLLCVLADGARWIWKQAQALFPSEVEMLDSYPDSEHAHKLAALHYGAYPARPREWCEATLARLFWGEVHGVIWGLQRMQPTDAQTAEEIGKLIRSLQRHQECVDYRFARKGGYAMGSGGIEAANTCICHVRLKRSGAWWYLTHVNQMLALRQVQSHL